jgi:L-lactate dehydrogenase complex protein LldG
VDRFVPIYENAIEKVFENKDAVPSQFTFITGPSMTADIQATPFKGMHGPRRLIVILIG